MKFTGEWGKCGPVGPHDGKAQLCGIKHGKAWKKDSSR